MAEQKTKPTVVLPQDFLARIEPQPKREDALALLELYSRATEAPAVMWGPAIVGFGRYSYLYGSGHSGEYFAVGFSPRKKNLTLYFTDGFESHVEQLEALGAHTTATSCLYLKRLDAIDLDVLEAMVRASFERMNGVDVKP